LNEVKLITKVGNTWIAICNIYPSSSACLMCSRVPSSSFTHKSHSCTLVAILNDVFLPMLLCCWSLPGCCAAVLLKPLLLLLLPSTLLLVDYCFFLIFFVYVASNCTVLLLLCSYPCSAATAVALPLLLVAVQNVAPMSLPLQLLVHHCWLIVDFFLLICYDSHYILANAVATALPVAICSTVLAMPQASIATWCCHHHHHFHQLIVAVLVCCCSCCFLLSLFFPLLLSHLAAATALVAAAFVATTFSTSFIIVLLMLLLLLLDVSIAVAILAGSHFDCYFY